MGWLKNSLFIDSTRSKVTPWFGKKGMGIQDNHKAIRELIKDNVIKEIK